MPLTDHLHTSSCPRTLAQERAIARLVTEREVKEMQQQHQEKEEIYREKAREINEKCVMGDNRIKELQEKVRQRQRDWSPDRICRGIAAWFWRTGWSSSFRPRYLRRDGENEPNGCGIPVSLTVDTSFANVGCTN